MTQDLDKSVIDSDEPTVKVFLDIFEIGHGSRIFPHPMTILFHERFTRLLGDSYMLQPLGVIGRDDANPADIIEFNIGDDIPVMLVFASPEHPGNSAALDTPEATVGSALFKPAILR